MVLRRLAKAKIAGSIPVSRSEEPQEILRFFFVYSFFSLAEVMVSYDKVDYIFS